MARTTAAWRSTTKIDHTRASRSIAALREPKHCRACPLWKNATPAAFDEHRTTAHIALIGEQPGDREDLAGKPLSDQQANCWIEGRLDVS